MSHLTLFVFFTCMLVVAGLLLLPSRKDCLSNIQRLSERLSPGRLERIAGLDGLGLLDTDTEFWSASDRLRGLWVRFVDLTVLVRLTQEVCRMQPEPRQHARHILNLATAQSIYTLLAIPEAAICSAIPTIPHGIARLATIMHLRLSFDVQEMILSDAVHGIPQSY